MRWMRAVMLVALASLTGCCNLPSWFGNRSRPLVTTDHTPPSAPASSETSANQTIVLDIAVVERPTTDHFLNHELWDLGNEQGIDLETKPILEENGLRVGQIGGLIPAKLQALITSKRSCPDPRRQPTEPDRPNPVRIGADRPRLTFQVHEAPSSRPVELTQAQCFLEVTAIHEGEQRLRLRFLPRIKHGKSQIEPRVARDPEGTLRWTVEAREPIEDFPALGWELAIRPDEYVLIGARRDRPDTLGWAYFGTDKGNTQKLLVLRARLLSSQAIDDSLNQSPPLALQAGWTFRGTQK